MIKKEWVAITQEQAESGHYTAYITDQKTGQCYVIPEGRWCIGRRDDEEPRISLETGIPIETDDLYMSRRHAHITLYKNIIGENTLTIYDIGGRGGRENPTHVDGYQSSLRYGSQLFNGSEFEMGYTIFTVHLCPEGPIHPSKEQASDNPENPAPDKSPS